MALLLKSLGYLTLKSGGKALLKGDPGAVTHVIAPPWRTIDVGNGQTDNLAFASPLDPAEVKYYTLDWSTELDGTSDSISLSDFTLSPTAIAAGLLIHALSNDAKRVTVWLKIDGSLQSDARWSGAGETHSMQTRITTVKGQAFERTVRVTVKQL